MNRLQALLLVLVAATSGCASSAAPSPTRAATDAPIAAPADAEASVRAPPPVLLARVGAALKAVGMFETDFPGLSTMRPCIVLFEPEREWIVRCPGLAGTSGFEDTGASLDGVSVLGAPTLTLPGQTVPYEQVKMIVGRAGGVLSLAADGGAAQPVPFFLVQDLDSLHAHHPAFVDTSAEDWTAIFVHEYFHVFQFSRPAVAAFVKAWPKAWPQREAHSKFFVNTPAYREAITREADILREGITTRSKATSKDVLRRWLAAREGRIATFAGAFAAAGNGPATAEGFEQSDASFTFLEGTARYLEVAFLCDTSRARPDMSADPSFRHFAAFAGCTPLKVDGRDRVTGDFHYTLGMLVAVHLEVVNPGWKAAVFDDPDFLLGEARSAAGIAKP